MSSNYEGTLDRLTVQNHTHMKVLLRRVYTEVKTMPGSRGPWQKMIMRLVDKDGRGIYAELRGTQEAIKKAAEPWGKEACYVTNLKLTKSKWFAGHYVDLSEKACKAKAVSVAASHPQAMGMQKLFPLARSDFSVIEQQCQGRERVDVIGVVTELDMPPTSKPKANLWLKDLSGKEMLINVWGSRLVDLLAKAQKGSVVQIDNLSIGKKDNGSLEGTAEHFLDNDKHGFTLLHVDPQGSWADKLRELGTAPGERISLPWCPSLSGGGRLISDLGPCYVACAATLNAFGSAMEQGAAQDWLRPKR